MDVTNLVELRRDLHAHPELGYNEFRTAGIIADFLTRCGLEVHTGIGKTGVVGVLRRGDGKRMIGLRADIDALPMNDDGVQGWRSQHEGAAHACGHDGHTVMLLGAAEYLSREGKFNGTVCFIFQPAEEGIAGAKAMIEDGLFLRFPCDAIYAVHNWPELAVGDAQTRAGAIMGAGDRFDITVSGGGGHAAQPHLSRDTLLATSELVVQLNTIVARAIHPCEAATLTVARIQGGFSHNMIPAKAEITGTVRTLSSEVQDIIEARVRQLSEHITAAHGLSAEVKYTRYYPATVNSAAEATLALDAARDAGLNAAVAPYPAMTSEDFAFMLQEKPGAYVWLGSAPSFPLHHSQFDFNDDLIPYGVKWFSSVVARELG